jgi:PBP1b-binding outer membrane lipoprotein LpoB
MIWRRKYKLIAILAVIAVAVMLMGCSTKPKQELNALDRFWDALGGKATDFIKTGDSQQ